MAAKDRYKIIYNNLIDLIDEMSVPANYHILIDGIIHGKKNKAIADEIGVKISRVYQMYWQYIQWCETYTGLIYHEDFPPISREEYYLFRESHRGLKYPEQQEALKQYILSKQ